LRSAELDLKKLTSKLKEFADERRRAKQAVSRMVADHPWIEQDKVHFGKPQSDFDFEAHNPVAAKERLKSLEEEQISLSKKV
ncbi:unnamed protein product, partial [Hapterophycus canaliculatus]